MFDILHKISCTNTKKVPKRQLHPNSSTVLEKSWNKFEWNYMNFRDSQNAKRHGILIIMHWIFIYLTTNFHSYLNKYLRAYDKFFLAFSGWWLYLKFESNYILLLVLSGSSLTNLLPHYVSYWLTSKTETNRGTDKEQYIRSIAPTATPPTSVRLAETSQLDWPSTNEQQGKAMSTITLLNITDLWTTLLTGTLRNA